MFFFFEPSPKFIACKLIYHDNPPSKKMKQTKGKDKNSLCGDKSSDLKMWQSLRRLMLEELLILQYDKESAEGSNWVSQGGESESGQMVLKKVKWTYFDAYLCQTMWNHAKKSMKQVKQLNSLFLQGEVSSAVLKTWKTGETKT